MKLRDGIPQTVKWLRERRLARLTGAVGRGIADANLTLPERDFGARRAWACEPRRSYVTGATVEFSAQRFAIRGPATPNECIVSSGSVHHLRSATANGP